MKAKKVLALMLAAIMLVCTSVAATIAYLTDKDTAVNTFTVGQVHIKLDEAAVNEKGELLNSEGEVYEDSDTLAERKKENDYHLLPNGTYIKDPTVTVEAGSEETYVRMFVTFNFSSQLDEIFKPQAELIKIFNGHDAANWALKDVVEDTAANTRTYEFRYVGEEHKGTKPGTVTKTDVDIKLDPLFDSFTVPANLTNDQLATLYVVDDTTGDISQLTITVTAHAIQAAGFADADAAWAEWKQ